MDFAEQTEHLTQWYEENKRDLPWRTQNSAYGVWISETMLQQTTSRAVIPYYERFMERFPTLQKLAKAPQEDVLEAWTGLGYYSRARNLHKAAKLLSQMGRFPETFEELIELPGFGPYTARAVASISFEQPVGVVDGNTIRVSSRLLNFPFQWWSTSERNEIQDYLDHWVSFGVPSTVNQAFMELGASLCSPTSPACLLCPLNKHCQAYKAGDPQTLPAKKPKKNFEFWKWQHEIVEKNGNIALIQNPDLPFLKNHWVLPGQGKRLSEKPDSFDFQHTITHHKIYVSTKVAKSVNGSKVQWVPKKDVFKWSPLSITKKSLEKHFS